MQLKIRKFLCVILLLFMSNVALCATTQATQAQMSQTPVTAPVQPSTQTMEATTTEQAPVVKQTPFNNATAVTNSTQSASPQKIANTQTQKATRPKAAPIVPLDRIVAIVNNNVITESQLEQRILLIKEQMERGNVPIPSNKVLRHQVLQRMIDGSLQLQIADRLKLKVDNATLNKAIASIAQQNKMSISAFKKALESDGIRYSDFRKEIRDEILISRAQQRAVEPHIKVTPQEVNTFLKTYKSQENKNQGYHLRDILITLPDSPSPDEVKTARQQAQSLMTQLKNGANFQKLAVSESSGQEALQGGDLGWRNIARLPSVFADKVAKMKPGQVAGPIRTANGFHIIKLVGVRNNVKHHIITQTKVRHILMRPDAVTSNQQVKQKLEKIRQQIENGASYSAMAKKYSEDPGSATSGGDLGWVDPGDLVPPFEAAMNKLPIGKVSQPVHSQFGWHLIQVLHRRKKDVTKTYQKEQIEKFITKRKFDEAINAWIKQLRSESYIKIYQ